MAKKKKPSELVRLSRASLGRAKKPARKAPKPTKHDRIMEKLRHPSRWPSLARWQLAMERRYGVHHKDWPVWGLEALAKHVDADLARVR